MRLFDDSRASSNGQGVAAATSTRLFGIQRSKEDRMGVFTQVEPNLVSKDL